MSAVGIELNDEQMKDFSAFFKDQAAKKKFITDDDVVALHTKWKNG
jgi:cytochrome c553